MTAVRCVLIAEEHDITLIKKLLGCLDLLTGRVRVEYFNLKPTMRPPPFCGTWVSKARAVFLRVAERPEVYIGDSSQPQCCRERGLREALLPGDCVKSHVNHCVRIDAQTVCNELVNTLAFI